MSVEKLTIVNPVSVRFTESALRDLDGLAAIEGMERGEFIRHLVSQELEKQHRVWLARNSLFAHATGDATTTANDKVLHAESSKS